MALLTFFWSAALPLVEALTFTHLGAQASRYGAIRLWGSVGFIAAVLGLGWLLERLPLAAILWVSVAILGGILACAMVLPEKREDRHETDRQPIGDILRRREVKTLFAACFLMSAAHGALYVFYSIHLVSRGYGTTLVGFPGRSAWWRKSSSSSTCRGCSTGSRCGPSCCSASPVRWRAFS